mmetsp:Transcript_16591/g.23452  ORF Transcript_16591/g.23452 Transcript_16591/m.23452 type:complete len:297 (+) Transcript_16591:194-1084(+)
MFPLYKTLLIFFFLCEAGAEVRLTQKFKQTSYVESARFFGRKKSNYYAPIKAHRSRRFSALSASFVQGIDSTNAQTREISNLNDLNETKLPILTEAEQRLLSSGQRVQRQIRNGNSGSGLVVVDVKADPDTVGEVLQRYSAYKDMIDTVREAKILDIDGDVTKAEFLLSRFKLRVRVHLKAQPETNSITFELDPECTSAGKSILKEARGKWYIQSSPKFKPGYCRVYLMANLVVSSFVPGFLVDYASARALPRASSWLKPTCERVQRTRRREIERLKLSEEIRSKMMSPPPPQTGR